MKNIVKNVFYLCCIAASTTLFSQNIEIGKKAFDVEGFDIKSNKNIKVSQFKNKKHVLLNFTATYCGPCWKTYPHMDELQKKYPSDLKVISVHGDEKKDTWYKIAKRLKIDFKSATIWDFKNKDMVKKKYDVKQYPMFFIIDKQGNIVDKWIGNKEKRLRSVIKNLITN